MKRARRILVIALAAAGILVALTLAFAAFVVFTTPGGRVALDVANGRGLPVRAASFDGSLAGRFRLFDVELRVGPVEAHIDTVTVAWRPRALRDRRVDVADLEIAGARVLVDTTHTADEAHEASAPEDTSASPWTFAAQRLCVRNATLVAPGDVNLRDVDIDGSGGPDGYRAAIDARGDAWRFSGVRVLAHVAGNTDAATLDSLTIDALGGHMHGGGFLRWSPDVAWNARVEGENVRAGEIAKAPEDWLGAISFQARSTGELRDDSTRIDIDLASLDGTLRDRLVSARGRVTVHGHVIEASDARVRWGSARATLSGSMAEVADVTLDADIPSLGEILPRARGSARVKGRLSGTPNTIQINVTLTGRDVIAAGRDIPNLDAVVDARLDAEEYVPYAADVRRADIRLAGGALAVRGKASWKNGVAWEGSVAAENFQTGTLAPARWDIRGPLSLRVQTSGLRTASDLKAHLAIESLTGTFRERALTATGTVDVRNREADVSQLRVDWGDMHVAADGHYGDAIDLALQVNAPDLAIVRDDLAGALRVDATVKGMLKKPAIDATFSADSLRVQKYGVHRLEGDVDFDPSFATPARATIIALGLSTGGEPLDSVRLDVNGPREGHTIAARVVRGALHAALSARGALADSVWSGSVESLQIGYPAAGEWRTSTAAPVRVTPSSAALDSLVLVSNGARLAARGAWARGDTTRVAVDLDKFPLSTLAHHFPQGTRITGTLDGSAAVRVDPAGIIRARARFQPGPGRITLGGKFVEYSGEFVGRADDAGVAASVDLALTRGNDRVAAIRCNVAIPDFVVGRDSLGAHRIDGALDVDCSDIAPLLGLLAPDFATGASGTLDAHFKTVGSARDFRIAGTADLARARFDLANGLKVRDVALKLAADGMGQMTVEGGATSGGGRVNVTAKSTRGGDARISGLFSVNGERFQLLNQPDAQVFVSPAIEVRLTDRDLDVTGDVRVPYARIEIAEVPATAVSPSRDVVFVEDTLSTQSPLRVKTKVRVALGDSVTFSGFGLRARLAGGLAVEDEVGQPTRGTGEIQIKDGKYRAYGNDLTIDPGRFVFGGGPVDNPGLDVRAYRGLTTQNVMAGSSEMVGVKLAGTLRKPEFSVFSNPPMSESETLSYLMFGRPLSSGSSSDQAAMANAAMILGMAQGNQLAGDIGKQFMLDDAYLETGEEMKEASFVAGKYLSPKLYVSYAAGFFEQTNTFRVRYSLSDSWTLQAESGKYASSDILYRFERGK